MSKNDVERLLEAAKNGTLEDIRAAFEACSIDKREKYGHSILCYAATNIGPDALDIIKFLVERRAEVSVDALRCAARNSSPHTLDMVKLMVERGAKPNSDTFNCAAGNDGPCALGVVKFLIEQGGEANPWMLHHAAWSHGPCALDIVKLVTEHLSASLNNGFGECIDCHEKNSDGDTAFLLALVRGNFAVADYLFFRDDFLLSDIMPLPKDLPIIDMYKTYVTYREKAILRVSKAIDAKELPYAKVVAADIEKILKTQCPKPTEEDIEVLEPLVRKIASKDWVSDARVSSNEFLDCCMER